MKRLLLVLSVCLLAAAPAFADITVTMNLSMNMGPIVSSGQATGTIKGTKYRSDAKIMGQDVTILVDPVTRQPLLLNNITKEVVVFDPQQAMAGLPVTIGEVAASAKPLGQTKEILGRTCQGFTVEVSMPMSLGGETVTMKMTGPVWLAKDGPGVAEYVAAQKALIGRGISLSPLGQGPSAKGMAEVSKVLADAGITMEQEIHVALSGAGQMAQMMGQMGDMTMKMTVTAISTEPIPDAAFKVPDGYTKK